MGSASGRARTHQDQSAFPVLCPAIWNTDCRNCYALAHPRCKRSPFSYFFGMISTWAPSDAPLLANQALQGRACNLDFAVPLFSRWGSKKTAEIRLLVWWLHQSLQFAADQGTWRWWVLLRLLCSQLTLRAPQLILSRGISRSDTCAVLHP